MGGGISDVEVMELMGEACDDKARWNNSLDEVEASWMDGRKEGRKARLAEVYVLLPPTTLH